MAEAIRIAPVVLPKSVADMAVDTMTQHGVSAVQDGGDSWRCRSCDYFLFPEEVWEGPCDCVSWRWVRVILELPVTPQASSAERSEESLVSAVAEALRDFKFEVGPNTLEMLRVGQAVYLTPEERHQIAHAAVSAYRQVVADE